MSRPASGHRWPLLWLLAALLCFCLTAPRSWERPRAVQAGRGLPPSLEVAPASEDSPAVPKRQTRRLPPVEAAPGEPGLAASGISANPLGLSDSPAAGRSTWKVAVTTTPADIYRRRLPLCDPPRLAQSVGGFVLYVPLGRLAAQLELRQALESERFAWRPSRAMPGPVVIDLAAPTAAPIPAAPLAPVIRQDGTSTRGPRRHQAAVEAAAPAPSVSWPRPEKLLDRVARWQCDGLAGGWAYRVESLLRSIPDAPNDLVEVTHELDALGQLADEAESLAQQSQSPAQAAQLRRTGFALRQHGDAWRLAAALAARSAAGQSKDPATARLHPRHALAWALAEWSPIETWGAFWKNYLVWEAMQSPAAGANRAAASSPQPSESQRLLVALEDFENRESSVTAQALAGQLAALRAGDDAVLANLAQRLDDDFRGANLRMVVAGPLVERMSMSRAPMVQAVRRTIQGVPVRGSSVTTSDVHLRLVPDPHTLRIAIEAEGQIASKTSSRAGPALLLNRSDAHYRVRKSLGFSLNGIQASPAEVEVSSSTRLRGVESTLDWVPLVGSVTRGIIRNQYEDRRQLTHRETQSMLRGEIGQRVEQETRGQLSDLNAKLHQRLMVPLERLGLVPAITAQTTAERMTLRARLATEQQLAAHTPRPRAPAGSLASLQLHESAANNVVEQLGLDGGRFTLAELYERIREKLNLPEGEAPESMPKDVDVTFAAHDAARLTLAEGKIKLTLRLAEVHHKSDHWRDFEVYVTYRPDLSTPHGQLVRDGVVQMAGKRLRAKGQVALRGIFSRIFGKDKPLALWPKSLADDPRLADLVVTQLVVDEGWIGWALGPQTKTAAAEPAASDESLAAAAKKRLRAFSHHLGQRLAARRPTASEESAAVLSNELRK